MHPFGPILLLHKLNLSLLIENTVRFGHLEWLRCIHPSLVIKLLPKFIEIYYAIRGSLISANQPELDMSSHYR